MSRWRLWSVAAVLVLFSGCRPALEFIGDPVLEQSLFDAGSWERRLAEQVGEYGYRSRVFWPRTDQLSELRPEERIAAGNADIFMLSPYQSLVLPELPNTTDSTVVEVLPLRLPESSAGVTVVFDPSPAWRRAGEFAAQWQREEPERLVVIFALEEHREQADAFESGFRDRMIDASALPEYQRFQSAPDRQALSGALGGYRQDDRSLFVFLLGRANQTALELTRGTAVRVGVPGVDPRLDPERILFSVMDDLVSAAGAVVAAESTGELPVMMVVESALSVYLGPDETEK